LDYKGSGAGTAPSADPRALATRSGRRVSYDKFWGALLVYSCFVPAGDPGGAWGRFSSPGGAAGLAWLLIGTVAGGFALVFGFRGFRGRWRHFLNYALGGLTTAVPLAFPSVWDRFPEADPARLPLGELGSIGWVILVAMGAVYAGCGIRIVRPSQALGQSLGGLGALLVAVFAFLPVGGGAGSYAYSRLALLGDAGSHWTELAPFGLAAAGVACGVATLVRSRTEVLLAKLARALLTSALLFSVILPLLVEDDIGPHLPQAWGAIRLFGPLFLAVDGAIAFVAISITRSAD